jgi:hypothetical protein
VKSSQLLMEGYTCTHNLFTLTPLGSLHGPLYQACHQVCTLLPFWWVLREQLSHVQRCELALIRWERPSATVRPRSGNVHPHGHVVVNDCVYVPSTHVRRDVGDRILHTNFTVKGLQLVREHRVIVRTHPVHSPVHNVWDLRVPTIVCGEQVVRLDDVRHVGRVLEAAKIIRFSIAHALSTSQS